ncbi:MAG: HD domain-containing protein [Proteobacteria bacterium]|nr:HD domain-containing protein [Pseudomonadota bacterium]
MSKTICPGQDTRFWKPGDIFEVACGKCGRPVEFFKDDSSRRCPGCGQRVQNPRISLGCAQWCEHAKECLGYDPKESREQGAGSKEQRAEGNPDYANPSCAGEPLRRTGASSGSQSSRAEGIPHGNSGQVGQEEKQQETMIDRLIEAVKKEFGCDQKRITHALLVLEKAQKILRREGGNPRVVLTAALLHDIGIKEAERKHGSAAGKYQEIEGPPIAERIMRELSLDAETIEHVSRIVGSHHSAKDIDTLEFRILWDADWLVNLHEEFPDTGREELKKKIAKIFNTETGRKMATDLLPCS